MQTLSPWGAQAWGDGQFARFKEHVEGLRFHDAAALLAEKLDSAVTATGDPSAA